MDALTVAAFEQRAAESEARLNALESKLAASAARSGPGVEELQALRALLAQAREETVKLSNERNQAVTENEKLKYQVKHLKRALVEADAKLAA